MLFCDSYPQSSVQMEIGGNSSKWTIRVKQYVPTECILHATLHTWQEQMQCVLTHRLCSTLTVLAWEGRSHVVCSSPHKPLEWLRLWLMTNVTNRIVGVCPYSHSTNLSVPCTGGMVHNSICTAAVLLVVHIWLQMGSDSFPGLSLVSVLSLIACGLQFFTAALLTHWYGGQNSTEDRWILLWLFYDVIVHLTLVQPIRNSFLSLTVTISLLLF